MDADDFAGYLTEIEAVDGDIEKRDLVAELLSSSERELPTVVRFLLGRVFPAYDSTTLDVGPRLCYDALARAAGQNVSADDVETRVAQTGDIGAVAERYDLGGQQGLAAFGAGGPKSLTINEVTDRLGQIAEATGDGSQDRKRDILFDLFNRTEPREARYLARLVLEEMRIGVGEGVVRDAIAAAFDVPVDAVERALQLSNDYGYVAEIARDDGLDGLTAISLEIGRPVQAMLAQSGTVRGALESWETTAVEIKYDGARVQAHYDGERVALFSRNMEDVTDALPEIVSGLESSLQSPVILDGEIVAVDESGTPLPFQEVLRRFRRKHEIAKAREDTAVRLHVFDCLHMDGADLLDVSLQNRHERMREVVPGAECIENSRLWLSDDPEEIADIETRALESGHEGVMLKNPDSTYTPGKRGQNWLKRKPDVETLDCVVTGAEWGEGRRASLLGTFELSVRDGDSYEPIGKVATGITDEELDALTARLSEHILSESGTSVDIDPQVVFEVGYEEIQRSPTYSSGYALRFPRFLGVREDKDPKDAESLERIESLLER